MVDVVEVSHCFPWLLFMFSYAMRNRKMNCFPECVPLLSVRVDPCLPQPRRKTSDTDIVKKQSLLLVWSSPIQVRVKRVKNSQCSNRPKTGVSPLPAGSTGVGILQSRTGCSRTKTPRRGSERGSTEGYIKKDFTPNHVHCFLLRHYSSTRTFSER